MPVHRKSSDTLHSHAKGRAKGPKRRQLSGRYGTPSEGAGQQARLQLTEAILLAAEQSGEDCQGKDGLVGYLRRIANEDVRTFSSFLAKVLPLQVGGDPESPLRLVVSTGIDRAPDQMGESERDGLARETQSRESSTLEGTSLDKRIR